MLEGTHGSLKAETHERRVVLLSDGHVRGRGSEVEHRGCGSREKSAEGQGPLEGGRVSHGTSMVCGPYVFGV